MKLPPEYYVAIKEYSRKARAWIDAHPGVEAKVQFNYPHGVFLSAVPQDAIDQHYVSVDDNGRDLLTAMGAFDDDAQAPSISMIRFALEYLEEIRKEDKDDGHKD